MLLGGLWHGAGWGFIIWGFMHGSGIIVERFLGMTRKNRNLAARLAWGFVVQLWVTAAWVFFRQPHLSEAVSFLWKMLSLNVWHDVRIHSKMAFYLLYAVPVVVHNFFPLLIPAISRKRLGLVLGASTALMLLMNIIICSPRTAFIYFRF